MEVGMNRSTMKTFSLLAALAAIGVAGTVAAADTGSKPLTVSPAPSDVKPIPPSRSELPDAAFKKLDAAGKGYVSRDDAQQLEGFGAAFDRADANHDGRLDQDEFKRAWTMYARAQL
jgi:hypothetical protein